jgi:hypothetical protein
MDKKKDVLSNVALASALTAAAIFGGIKANEHYIGAKETIEQKVQQSIILQATELPELEQKVDYSIAYNQKTNLAVVRNRDSFQFYGDRVVKGGKYKEVDADLYELLMPMADSYKKEFSQKLFVGPMWDDQGHSKNSKHYEGKAVDIDFGANVGTKEYELKDRVKAEFLLRYIRNYAKEHNKEFKVLFNDKDFIKEGLCTYFEGHHNHIHIGK